MSCSRTQHSDSDNKQIFNHQSNALSNWATVPQKVVYNGRQKVKNIVLFTYPLEAGYFLVVSILRCIIGDQLHSGGITKNKEKLFLACCMPGNIA